MSLGSQRLRRYALNAVYVLIGAALVTAVLYAVVKGPYDSRVFPVTPGLKDPSQARWLSAETRGNRTALLTVIGGTLAAIGAFLTFLNFRVAKRGQLSDRFAKALVLLADEKAAVRLGGVYALENVARESPVEAQAVINVLRFHGQDEDHPDADVAAARIVADGLAPTAETVLRGESNARRAAAVAMVFGAVAAVGAIGVSLLSNPDRPASGDADPASILTAVAAVSVLVAVRTFLVTLRRRPATPITIRRETERGTSIITVGEVADAVQRSLVKQMEALVGQMVAPVVALAAAIQALVNAIVRRRR